MNSRFAWIALFAAGCAVRDVSLAGKRCGPGHPCPDGLICDAVSSTCQPTPVRLDASAPLDGASADASSNADAGPIDTGEINPGKAQLDTACNFDRDCASDVCFDFGAAIGRLCIAACRKHDDCPAGFACLQYSGARLCASAARFPPSTFAGREGDPCTRPGDCRSNFCDRSGRCGAECSEAADCTGTSTCSWYNFAYQQHMNACIHTATTSSAAVGGSCHFDRDCASGVCQGSMCARFCRTSAHCRAAEVCKPIDESECVVPTEVGFCQSWYVEVPAVCAPDAHGFGAVGDMCAGPGDCRSGRCDVALAQCTDLCAIDADCPPTHVCKVQTSGQEQGGQKSYVDLCLPR
jgi:hypothetical protein